ncbi:uncharacterized protein TRIVIDRAFT_43445 [Trichoderma virens Gv29-8]|uniref:Uncharacterized protein n=1 Tax=Hypocrea virens (strain Gv29-8 / FGSC 10586) TaxID=413071 RepID=G9N6Y6_HYPVG|nr:uncharacterized protein TRIVIDRAFT_43445 [Trichoderma virens Gv29-8]EHK17484.1 hypothetical protein TRIVIDRAFT_43445 [Trichoderma virens Gv29-8]UKZ53794.1 hypothetical protein TrVGV298_007594 [Trichoderma virens]
MKDSGPSVPRWALLAPAAAPPILTFDEPSLELLSRTDSHNSSDPRSNPPLLQPAGGMCSPEGQWNCMTTSWQRCASGMWSAAVPCATGTICQPFGLTDFITIEHEASASDSQPDNGHASDGRAGDGHDRSGKKSLGLRNSPSLVLLVGALLTGVSWGFLA